MGTPILIKANKMNKFHYRWPKERGKPRSSTLCWRTFWECEITEQKALSDLDRYEICDHCAKKVEKGMAEGSGEKVRKPKLRTLVEAFAFHLADLLGMDEDNEKTVKKYHALIDEYVKHIEDITHK